MIRIVKGDITEVECDAIVNPANTLGLMGGGVAKAIRDKGGREIEDEAKERAPIPLGGAIATGAGRLKAKWVIHAPTVKYPGDRAHEDVVRRAIRSALEVADRLGARCVAFPSMGTGVGGIPEGEGARILVETISEAVPSLKSVKKIVLVAFSDSFYRALQKEWKRVFGIVD